MEIHQIWVDEYTVVVSNELFRVIQEHTEASSKMILCGIKVLVTQYLPFISQQEE